MTINQQWQCPFYFLYRETGTQSLNNTITAMSDSISFCLRTSVRSHTSPLGCPGNGQVVIESDPSGQNCCVICCELNVKLLVFQGKHCVVLALPLLEFTLLVTLIEADSAAFTFPLCTQTPGPPELREQKPVTSCPAQIIAVLTFFVQTKSSVLASQQKVWI